MSISRITADLDASEILGPLSIIAVRFKKLPMPSLYDAVQPLIDEDILPGLEVLAKSYYSQVVNAKKPGGRFEHDALSPDCIAALKLYSTEELDPPLYGDLNTKCYQPDRRSVRPYAKFLLLLHHALKMIPRYDGGTIFRGVKKDLRGSYNTGREVTWQGLTSCTTSIEVLKTPQLLGTSGGGTIFIIQLTQQQAREISKYSVYPGEHEVLLPAGSKFEVVGNLQHDALTLITLKELKSDDIFMDLQASLAQAPPASKTPAKAPASVPAPAPAKATASKALALALWGFCGKRFGKAALAAPVAPAASAAAAADALAKFLNLLSPDDRRNALAAGPQKLDLVCVDLDSSGVRSLAEVVQTDKTLKSINLTFCAIGAEGAEQISKALFLNNTLEELHLCGNNIGNKGARSLAEALQINGTLRMINLSGNKIGFEGAEPISYLLMRNKTLQELDLNFNNIGERGARSLADALKINRTLRSIDLRCNDIGSGGRKALRRAEKPGLTIEVD